MKNIGVILFENFQFLVVKFSIYLKRRVFVMYELREHVPRCSKFSPYSITKTYLYNFTPLKPNFYIVKLGFTGYTLFFLITAQKHWLWILVGTASAVLTGTHILRSEQKYEKYPKFYLKPFTFWWWNFQYIWICMCSWWSSPFQKELALKRKPRETQKYCLLFEATMCIRSNQRLKRSLQQTH